MIIEFDRDPSVYPDGNIVEVYALSYPGRVSLTYFSGTEVQVSRPLTVSPFAGLGMDKRRRALYYT
jgi:hypothetical protein